MSQPPDQPAFSSSPSSHGDDDAHERQLVERIRAAQLAGQGLARPVWGELFTLYQHRIYAICLRMIRNEHTASDLTQDAFIKILKGLDSWDGRSKLSTWIIRVTMNVCLSHLRAAKLRTHTSLDGPIASSLTRSGQVASQRTNSGDSSRQSQEPDALSRVQQEELGQGLTKALDELDPETRAILLLRDMHDLDYQQIAEVLEVPTGTVKSRLFRARLALRQALERRGFQ